MPMAIISRAGQLVPGEIWMRNGAYHGAGRSWLRGPRNLTVVWINVRLTRVGTTDIGDSLERDTGEVAPAANAD